MRLPDDLAIIHEPVRLGVMAVLQRSRRVRMAALREALKVTDGNLATHVRRLEEAGFVEVQRGWSHDGFQAFAMLTPSGAAAIVRYAAAMRALLEAVDQSDQA